MVSTSDLQTVTIVVLNNIRWMTPIRNGKNCKLWQTRAYSLQYLALRAWVIHIHGIESHVYYLILKLRLRFYYWIYHICVYGGLAAHWNTMHHSKIPTAFQLRIEHFVSFSLYTFTFTYIFYSAWGYRDSWWISNVRKGIWSGSYICFFFFFNIKLHHIPTVKWSERTWACV